MLAQLCRQALTIEPRFAAIYPLAVTAREQAEQGFIDLMQVLCTSISWALPQPVLIDAPAHAMRVKIGDVSFPRPGGASKRAGLADMRVELDCAEVGGTEIAPEPDAIGARYFSQNTRALEFGNPVHLDWPWVGTGTLTRRVRGSLRPLRLHRANDRCCIATRGHLRVMTKVTSTLQHPSLAAPGATAPRAAEGTSIGKSAERAAPAPVT